MTKRGSGSLNDATAQLDGLIGAVGEAIAQIHRGDSDVFDRVLMVDK
jgi:hypothetical protein